MDKLQIWDRQKQAYIQEIQDQQEVLKFLYTTVIGRSLLWLVAKRRWFSWLMASQKKSKSSQKQIPDFVAKHQIDLSVYTKQSFESFNDFFTREKVYKTCTAPMELMAVADARLLVTQVSKEAMLTIKGSRYSIDDLIKDKLLARQYEGGVCFVYRLALEDYHRYVYVDKGYIVSHKKIQGQLHTIRSLSNRYKVFIHNTRVVTQLKTQYFGDVLQIEVGAMTVGKIRNHCTQGAFEKLEEKGYFEYGGSTIIQIFKANQVVVDEDIQAKSLQQIEVKVQIGEKIGDVKKT